jgi:hypothetical protein
MSNVKESFGNINSNNRRYFLDSAIDSSYNYYTLDTRRFKYKLATLPSGLILESSNNVTLQNRNLNNFRTQNIMLSYYNNETDVSLLNIRANTTIMLDISTISTTDLSNSKTINMVFIENSGNFYDLSNEKLSKFSMKINGENVIVNGQIFQLPTPPTPTTETSANILNNPQANNFYNDFNLYFVEYITFSTRDKSKIIKNMFANLLVNK